MAALLFGSAVAALLLHRGVTPPLPRSSARVGSVTCEAVGSASDSPFLALGNFNVGTWRGRCTRVSPTTAEPLGEEIAYVQQVVTEQRNSEQLVLRSITQVDGADAAATDYLWPSSTTDIDLDGTYSAEYSSLEQAALFGAAAAAAQGQGEREVFVVEHSIASSDEERRRCLLVYRAAAAGEEGEAAGATKDGADAEAEADAPMVLHLEEALLLHESRQPEGAVLELAMELGNATQQYTEPAPTARCTMSTLFGSWTGDASVRRPQPASALAKKRRPPPPTPASRAGDRGDGAPKGFGAKGKEGKAPLRSLFGEGEARGALSTNVYKATLSFSELYGTVVRTLGITAFGGDDLDPISSMGRLLSTRGLYTDYEAVSFDPRDPSQPRMLLLPAGCYVYAPTCVQAGNSFSTEFGVVLPPGESFGWKGFITGDDEVDDAARMEAAGKAGAGLSDSTTARLVRVQRLYDGVRFVSGTTSLCSAEE